MHLEAFHSVDTTNIDWSKPLTKQASGSYSDMELDYMVASSEAWCGVKKDGLYVKWKINVSPPGSSRCMVVCFFSITMSLTTCRFWRLSRLDPSSSVFVAVGLTFRMTWKSIR